MSDLDQLLVNAVASGDAPFLVAGVADRKGVLWEGSAGEAREGRAAGPDTVFRLFSMTKGIGALAAMILIDRGELSLDTEVGTILPEFQEIKVLESIGPDGPVLREPRRACTLRHLLSHTSGFAYDSFNEKMSEYEKTTGSAHVLSGTIASMNYPLMFDPGDGFTYGISNDWAGRMVERVDGRTIDVFCQEEIFDPLGMKDAAFEPDAAGERLASIVMRGGEGDFSVFEEVVPPPRPEAYGMGQAMHASATDYLTFLRLVLNRGELGGRRLIAPETADLLFENQMGDQSMPPLTCYLDASLSADVDFFPGARKTWTAGFMRVEDDIPGMRHAGTISWAGFLNSHYWIDPVQGLAAVYMTQTLPFCDAQFMGGFAEFERCVYREFGSRDAADGEDRAGVLGGAAA